MKLTCIFDTAGIDGKDNKEAWNVMPSFMRLFIRQTQQKIIQMLLAKNPGREFQKTSGFRSPRVTARHGGKDHSHHHWGGAVDIARSLGDNPPLVDTCFVCVTEKDHYHIQYKVE